MPSNMLAKLMLSNVFGNPVVGRSMFFPLPKKLAAEPGLHRTEPRASETQSARLRSHRLAHPAQCSTPPAPGDGSSAAQSFSSLRRGPGTLVFRLARGISQLPGCARLATEAQVDIRAAEDRASCFPKGRNGAPQSRGQGRVQL